MNDTQKGQVIVNWQVTLVIVIGAMTAFGMWLGFDFVPSLFLGLFTGAIWLAFEIRNWEPQEGVEEPE